MDYGEIKLTELLERFENMTEEEYIQLFNKAKELEEE